MFIIYMHATIQRGKDINSRVNKYFARSMGTYNVTMYIVIDYRTIQHMNIVYHLTRM